MTFFNKNKFRLSLLSGAGLLLLVGVLALTNLLAENFFHRFDLTNDRRYALSDASRQLLKSLEDPLFVRFYLTPGLPQPYESQGRYIRDLLQEYRTASGGKMTVETVTPRGDEDKLDLNRIKLQEARFTQLDSDQLQVRGGYMGIALYYQDKFDVIPFVRDVTHLEYEISSRIRVMTQDRKKVLYFVSNHNEVSPQFIKEGPAGRLFDEFRVESTRLSKEATGLKPDAIFLLGSKTPLTPEELDVLDEHMVNGVPVVIALNRRTVFPNNFRSVAQTTGLEDFLDHYGVHVGEDFVMDQQCQNIAMQSRETAFYVKYWPFPLANTLNKEILPLKTLDVLGFPYAHGVAPSFEEPSPLRFTWLAQSSAKSWVWPGLYNVDPPSLFSQRSSSSVSAVDGPFTLAGLVEGSTVTFREPRRPVPHVKMVVIGTSFFADPQVPNPEGNALFILTMAQWLTQEKNYLTIPPKSPPFRPLKPVGAGTRWVVKFLGFFLTPTLILIAGFTHWNQRQKTKKKIQALFSQSEERSHE